MAHLLIPTDFSDVALQATSYALRLFDPRTDRFTLVHAYMDAGAANNVWPSVEQELYNASADGMDAFLERVRRLKEAEGVNIGNEVVFGAIGSVLADIHKEDPADLVVMGTKGVTGVPLFTSNAAHVAKISRVPVLVVPDGVGTVPVRRILLADDRQEHGDGALRMLVRLAQHQGAEVIVAHVQATGERSEEALPSSYEEALAQVGHRSIQASGDDPVESLLDLAEREQADLLAVLHRHTPFLDTLFHRSVSKQLAMHSPRPLLVLED